MIKILIEMNKSKYLHLFIMLSILVRKGGRQISFLIRFHLIFLVHYLIFVYLNKIFIKNYENMVKTKSYRKISLSDYKNLIWFLPLLKDYLLSFIFSDMSINVYLSQNVILQTTKKSNFWQKINVFLNLLTLFIL